MAADETTDSSGYSNYKSQRDAYLKAYLGGVEKKIAQRAQELAEGESGGESRQTPEIRHLAQASLDIAPGSVFPKTSEKTNEPTWWQRVGSSITGITIVAGILTLVFGGFGLFGPENNQGFLDIAKIFAGAVVGSAGEAVVTRYREG